MQHEGEKMDKFLEHFGGRLFKYACCYMTRLDGIQVLATGQVLWAQH